MNIEELFEIARVKRTELVGNAKSTIATFFQVPEKHPGDQWADSAVTDESEAVNAWQQYGFVSRLPKDAEALILRWGANSFQLASRVITKATVYGKLAEGAVAMFSVFGSMIEIGADGMITFKVPTDGGKDMFLILNPKRGGSLKFMIPDGPCLEISKAQGWYLDCGDKPITDSTTDKIQHIATQQIDMVGTHQLDNAGARPIVAATVAAGGFPTLLG